MSLLDEVRFLRVWSPADGELGKRLAIGRLHRAAWFVVYGGGTEAWKIESNQTVEFFKAHPNRTWLVDAAKPIFLWLSFLDLSKMIPQRQIIDLGLLYRLVHLAEFSDAAHQCDLAYLTTTYTQLPLECENGDVMPGIAAAIQGATSTALAALERAAAIWHIYPWLWREVIDYSGEQRLLGYDDFLRESFYARLQERSS